MAAMETAAVERVLQRLAADGSVEREWTLASTIVRSSFHSNLINPPH